MDKHEKTYRLELTEAEYQTISSALQIAEDNADDIDAYDICINGEEYSHSDFEEDCHDLREWLADIHPSEAESVWHDTSNPDDKPEIAKGEGGVDCLVEFDTGGIIIMNSLILDGKPFWCGCTLCEFDEVKRWAYVTDIAKLK